MLSARSSAHTHRTLSARSAPSVISTPSTLCTFLSTLCPRLPSAFTVPSGPSAPPPLCTSGPRHSLHSLRSPKAPLRILRVESYPDPLAAHFLSPVFKSAAMLRNQSYKLFVDPFCHRLR